MSRLWLWLPVALCAALIWSFSSTGFSSAHSSRIIIPLLRWLLPHAGPVVLDAIHLAIRKSAHLVEYFVLGLLLLRAVRGNGHGWNVRWAFIAVAIAAGYSGLDELHQIFATDRGPSVWDSLLDTAGATLAQLAAWHWSKREDQNISDVATRPS